MHAIAYVEPFSTTPGLIGKYGTLMECLGLSWHTCGPDLEGRPVQAL